MLKKLEKDVQSKLNRVNHEKEKLKKGEYVNVILYIFSYNMPKDTEKSHNLLKTVNTRKHVKKTSTSNPSTMKVQPN